MKDIVYKWQGEKAVWMDASLQTSTLKILSHKLKDSQTMLSTGNYSRLVAEVVMEPAFPGHFLYMKRLLPIILVTLLSFAPYFLPASPHRSLLTISSSLMTSLLVVLLNNGLPVVNEKCNMTFFDWYGLTCIVFTIISVVHEIRSHNQEQQEKEEVSKSVENAESQDKFRIPVTLRQQVTSKSVPLAFAIVTVASAIYMLFINSYKRF